VAAVARSLGLVDQTLFNWVKAERLGQLKGVDTKVVSAEQMEISRLRAELARVKKELDILGKRRRTSRKRRVEVRLHSSPPSRVAHLGPVSGAGGERGGVPRSLRATRQHGVSSLPQRRCAAGAYQGDRCQLPWPTCCLTKECYPSASCRFCSFLRGCFTLLPVCRSARTVGPGSFLSPARHARLGPCVVTFAIARSPHKLPETLLPIGSSTPWLKRTAQPSPSLRPAATRRRTDQPLCATSDWRRAVCDAWAEPLHPSTPWTTS
jgi:transposase